MKKQSESKTFYSLFSLTITHPGHTKTYFSITERKNSFWVENFSPAKRYIKYPDREDKVWLVPMGRENFCRTFYENRQV